MTDMLNKRDAAVGGGTTEENPIYDGPEVENTYVPTGFISYYGFPTKETLIKLNKAKKQFTDSLEQLRKDPTNPALLATFTVASKEYSTITSALAAIPDTLQKQDDAIIRRM